MPARNQSSKRFIAHGKGKEATRTVQRSRVTYEDQQLKIIFPNKLPDGRDLVVDVKKWLVIGELSVKLAEGFRSMSLAKSTSTIRTTAANFTNGFVAYAVENSFKLNSVKDLSEDWMINFLKWLNESKSKDSNEPLKVYTRLHYWGIAKAVIERCKIHFPNDKWNVYIPIKPFAKVRPDTKVETKEGAEQAYLRILEIAAEEAAETVESISPMLEKFGAEMQRLEGGGRPLWNTIEQVTASLLQRYKGYLPERKELKQDDPEGFDHVQAVGYTNIRRLAFPQSTDLVPFLYMLAVHTAFNQAALIDLRYERIAPLKFNDEVRITLSAFKARAGTIVRRSFSTSGDPLGVPELLKFIERWTAHLAKIAPEHVQGQVWIFANKWRAGKSDSSIVTSYQNESRQHTQYMSTVLMNYAKRHKSTFVGLRENRTRLADLFQEKNPNDLIGLQVLMAHQTIATTFRSYRSSDGIQTSQESLAGALAARERWVISKGKVDPRPIERERDRMAATPGFLCADPFSGRVSGEEVGRLCAAYGVCPACPLSAVVEDSAYALARLLQLKARYEKGREKLGQMRFERRYLLAMNRLESDWIPKLMNKATQSQAATLLLSPLPELD